MADQNITDLTALSADSASGDLFETVDVSDTTHDAAGTSKKVTRNEIVGATLAGYDSKTAPSGTVVGTSDSQTLTNKTINTASNNITVVEADISDLGSYITASSTDTLTNKTLTTPIISSISNTGTVTLPTATDTLVGRATTDTLTNKTINTASNTITIVEADISDLGSYITASSTDTLTNKTFDANGTGNSISNIDVADLSTGTDGELITWDSSGNPTTVAAGTSGHVLTSNGAGAAPTFQAGGGGGGLSDIVDDTTPQLGGQLDVNGNAIGDGTLELLKFSETASAVNELTITNAATGGKPILSATGDDTDISLQLSAKGTGTVQVDSDTVVTQTASQTLSNKTINTSNNTITIVEADISDLGSYITASSTDTLTNKTFDANGAGNSLSNVDVADLAAGTDGELITWDASGNPTTVAVGTSGHVLTSNGAGAAPTFQAAAGGGSSPWDVTSNVMSNTGTGSTVATDDFVFGSSQLDDDTVNDSRMFFDKSYGYFFAGSVNSTQADSGNRSWRGINLGENNTVSGSRAVGIGQGNTVSASGSFAFGDGCTSSAAGAFCIGEDSQATGSNSYAIGRNSIAGSATDSKVFGSFVQSTSQYAIAIGVGDTSTANKMSVNEDYIVGIGVRSEIPSFEVLDAGNGATAVSQIRLQRNVYHDYGSVQTTNATQTTVWTETLDDESSYIIKAYVVGKKNDSTARAVYGKVACVYRDAGGGATIQGSVGDIFSDIESVAGWDATITVSSNAARVSVTGAASTTVDWKVQVEFIKVS